MKKRTARKDEHVTLAAIRHIVEEVTENVALVVNTAFGKVEKRIDGVEKRIDGVDGRLATIERRLGDVDLPELKRRVKHLEADVQYVKESLAIK